jgi:hypothetical protein
VLGVKLSFMPYHYGPWSYEVNEALSALADAGLLGMDAEVRERIDGAPFQPSAGRGGLSSQGGLGCARSRPLGLGRRPGRERAPSSSSCKAFGRGAPAPTQTAKRPIRALPLSPGEHVSMIMNHAPP